MHMHISHVVSCFSGEFYHIICSTLEWHANTMVKSKFVSKLRKKYHYCTMVLSQYFCKGICVLGV